MSIGSLIICLLLLAFTPNHSKSVGNENENTVDMTRAPSTNDPDDPDEDPNAGYPAKSGAVTSLLSALRHTQILLIIPVFLIGIFRYTLLDILIQYASVRFGMKISTGVIFYTETAGVNIFLFLFIIPRTTAYLQKKYKVRPPIMDLVLVRTSVSLLCLGCLGIGLAPSQGLLPFGTSNLESWNCHCTDIPGVAIFAGGFGSRVSALALVSYWISDDAKAMLYAAVGSLESLGHAFGDPSMQQIFAKSLLFSPFWQALPFFVAAVSKPCDSLPLLGLIVLQGTISSSCNVYVFHTTSTKVREAGLKCIKLRELSLNESTITPLKEEVSFAIQALADRSLHKPGQ